MIPVPGLKDFSHGKILDYAAATERITVWQREGMRVGLCHGGFDLTHPGHALHFLSAKGLCDRLVVSVTSDRFVAGRKGGGRSVYGEALRAFMIACLECVDMVVISDFKTGVEVINELEPDLYIKGPDFVTKTTPGITAERVAIASVGGEMAYTTETKLSTTEIIDYIKEHVKPHVLIVLDRDGTLIKNNDFFGKEDDWQDRLAFMDGVIAFVLYLQTVMDATTVVVTNQAGVARGLFTEKRVEEINRAVGEGLERRGVRVDAWESCPDVDEDYARAHPEVAWDANQVKKVTRRKPGTAMVESALARIGKGREDFEKVLVIGDRDEDSLLAQALGARFFQAGSFGSLLRSFRSP